MRSRLRVLAALALAVLAPGGCRWLSRAGPPPPPRGILLVLAPGLEPGVAPSRTPWLSRLAARGRPFSRAFAVSPDVAVARAALLGAGPRSVTALFRARGLAAGDLGEPGAAELGLWLRGIAGRFLAVVSLPSPRALAEPIATEAGRLAPALPRIAADDLGFGDRPGVVVTPPAWSLPARERAEAAVLARAIAADAALGALLGAVERSAPDAAVVVVGDPPADRGAHGVVARPGLFDDTLASTLVVAARGLAQAGRASAAPVSTGDVAPTLLALAGLAAEPALDGRSLLPILADASAPGPPDVLSSAARRAGRVGRSARSARWRYTEWPDGSAELYDHDADPREIANLAGRPEARGVVAELRRVFEPAAPERPAERAGSQLPPPRGARGPAGRAPAARRNVLLVVVDDLNTRVGAWGAPVRTPNLDRLAARGVRFERAYAAVAMCSPSRVSLMTGWRPERTGVWNNLDPPRPPGAVPLQEHFATAGYRTAAVGKVYHFPEEFRWDVQEEHPQVVEDEREGAPAPGGEGLWSAAAGGDLDQPDGQRALRAAQLIERFRAQPFFVAVGFVRPHLRWIAPARYFGFYPPEAVSLDTYPPDDLADVPALAVKTRPQALPGLPLLGREPPGLVRDPVLRRQAIAAYEACTTFADAQLGVLLGALDRLDLWKSTVVVLAGDNGFHLGEHGGLLRKDTLFEEGIHVPLVVVEPGGRRGVARAPVELPDVYPTLVELAGLPAVPGLDARSLVPLLSDPGGAGRGPAVSYRRVQPPERGWSLRGERLRYTLWPDGSEELYDTRASGPHENLAARPERAGEKHALRARLERTLAVRPGL
jgi:arylsulfatase A-like enzyme